MQTKDDLIRENAELRARLELAEKWMQREVRSAMQSIERQGVKSRVRRHFANLLEDEGIDIIARRIYETFGSRLEHAPEFTLERLIDAEIYWQTLQKYPTMDGLPIILAYQKILDAWTEKVLVAPWRNRKQDRTVSISLGGGTQGGFVSGSWKVSPPTPPHRGAIQAGLDRDIENIITKKYTLSIGRLYQILEFVREGKYTSPTVSGIVDFWKAKVPEILATLISDEFFLPFSELMEREIFTKKRHEKKVTFSDVKKAREDFGMLLQKIL